MYVSLSILSIGKIYIFPINQQHSIYSSNSSTAATVEVVCNAVVVVFLVCNGKREIFFTLELYKKQAVKKKEQEKDEDEKRES